MTDFTERELDDIIRQMGQRVENNAALHMLKNEIDRYLNEDFETENDDVLNGSMFASLAIDPASHFVRHETDTPEMIQSPIVTKRRRGKFRDYENLDYPDDVDDESSSVQYPDAHALISQAYQTIGRIYDSCRSATHLVESLSLDDEGETIQSEDVGDEEEENISESISISAGSGTETATKKSTGPAKIIVDPSVRPVLSPKPGRAPFKFDPVTRYHLYKEEWERHPAPGEMRRLSLRWKVREYMLRHDVPQLTIPMNSQGRAEHDKDWSPRPYMD